MINISAYAANTPECVEFTVFDDNFLEGDSSLMWEIVDVSPQIAGVDIDPNLYEFIIVDDEGETVEFITVTMCVPSKSTLCYNWTNNNHGHTKLYTSTC